MTWGTSGGGFIDARGLFTASSSAPGGAVFDVIARSVADPSSFGGASVSIVAEDVSGSYVGEACLIDFGICQTNQLVNYSCDFGSGCGWYSAFGRAAPEFAPDCFVSTDGLRTGGAFTGRINTFCAFLPLSRFAQVRIEGTIGGGRLVFTVFGPDGLGVVGVRERWNLAKVTP